MRNSHTRTLPNQTPKREHLFRRTSLGEGIEERKESDWRLATGGGLQSASSSPIAFRIFSGVIGRSRIRTPMAS